MHRKVTGKTDHKLKSNLSRVIKRHSVNLFLFTTKCLIVAGLIMGAVGISIIGPQLHSKWLKSMAKGKVVRLVFNGGGGTGFQVTAKSGKQYLLTNKHVCLDAYLSDQPMEAILPGNKKEIKKVVDINRSTDLCLLEPLTNTKSIKIAQDYEDINTVFVIGWPGLKHLTLRSGEMLGKSQIELPFENITPTFTQEVCESIGGYLYESQGYFGIPIRQCVIKITAVDTTVGIHPGNSGGPAVNWMGQLIGVAFATDNRLGQGMVIPLEDVKDFLREF